jgi:cytochrome P450
MSNTWSGQQLPTPAGRRPVFGHMFQLDRRAVVQSILRLTDGLGPIVEISILGQRFVFVTSAELAREFNDESRFRKSLPPGILALRSFAGDGLFTAYSDEPNWQLAHDLLAPAFTKSAMQSYHPVMLGAAAELIAKWDHAAGPVDVTADLTRLTLETIGRTSFGQDFGSFERDEQHPMVGAMLTALTTGQRMAGISAAPVVGGLLRRRLERKVADQIGYAERFVDDVIARRRAAGDLHRHDLLGIMLDDAHPETGQRMSDVNIRYQVLTFLVAGHETTSGALSFALYYLARNPAVLRKAQAETDAILGADPDAEPTYDQVARFRYLRKILDEALRLWPTAPGYGRGPRETTVLSTGHTMTPEDTAIMMLPAVHRDPAVWGPTADQFDPERPRPKLGGASNKPFGTGERACIGRQFALHEALLVLARLLHRYDLAGDPSYELKVGERLTLVPKGFELAVTRRTPGIAVETPSDADEAPATCPFTGTTAS